MEELFPPDRLLQDAARFISHPAFSDAVKVYCVALARFQEAPMLLNAVIATEARWRIIGYLLYLAADTERFGPQGGATYVRILTLCTRREEASARVVKTLLGLLKLAGLVRVARSKTDARIRLYQPTARLDRFVAGWMAYAVAALDVLEPAAGRARFLDDPAFVRRFHVSGGRAHLSDPVPLVDRMPAPLSVLLPMLGSFSVVVGVMEAVLCGTVSPFAAVLARRFGLSRSQVANVLAAGQQAGLFVFGPQRRVTATPALHDSFAEWISIELAFYARYMRPPGEPVAPVMDELV